jgi:hypothetical protein
MEGRTMTNHKFIITLAFVSTLLLGLKASAQGPTQGSCVFYAPDSTYYGTGSPSANIYAHGPISFVWEPTTGRILGGYYPERVVARTPVATYFNNVISGSITAGPVSQSNLNLTLTMRFDRSVPDSYRFVLNNATLVGTTTSARLSGKLDGPLLFEATGTGLQLTER